MEPFAVTLDPTHIVPGEMFQYRIERSFDLGVVLGEEDLEGNDETRCRKMGPDRVRMLVGDVVPFLQELPDFLGEQVYSVGVVLRAIITMVQLDREPKFGGRPDDVKLSPIAIIH